MLNLNFNERVVISTDDQPWGPTGLAGIDIKPLELEDADSGHLTALIRYRDGSIFSRKELSYGEEMLILNGCFRGQFGDYKTGTYYRSPPNHEQIPLTQKGCVLFLKLNQFDSKDIGSVVVDTKASDWTMLGSDIKVQLLHQDSMLQQQSSLYQWKSGTQIPTPKNLDGGAEMFVLKGCIRDSKGEYPAGTWLRTPGNLLENPIAVKDSAAFIKYGHLHNKKINIVDKIVLEEMSIFQTY